MVKKIEASERSEVFLLQIQMIKSINKDACVSGEELEYIQSLFEDRFFTAASFYYGDKVRKVVTFVILSATKDLISCPAFLSLV